MNKLFLNLNVIFCIGILLFNSCKSTELVPTKLNNESSEVFFNPKLNSDSKLMELALLKILQNDTIKKEVVMLTSSGLDSYYWISFEKLESSLLEKYSIDFSTLLYNVITKELFESVSTDFYRDYLELTRAEGYIPHLVFPNLDKITNRQVDTNGVLHISNTDINTITKISTSSYFEDNPNVIIHSIEGESIVENKIDLKKDYDIPLIIIAYRVIDPCIYPGCDIENTLIRNCIVSDISCRMCNNSSNNNISNNGSGFFGSHEITIKLLTNNNSSFNDGGCYSYEYNGPLLTAPPFNTRTYGMLTTVPNFDYYLSEYEFGKSQKTRLPIMHFTGNSLNNVKSGNSLTLCYVDNYFHSYNDQIENNKVLGGGIYKIKRFNAPSLYFAFPGHVLGGMFWLSGPDNSITYNLNINNEICNLGQTRIQNEFKYTSGCEFCKNNIFGLSDKYFINTDLGFLQNYWNRDTIIVGIAKNPNFIKMPIDNIIKFSTSSPTCNQNVANKILVAELRLENNLLDNYKTFNENLTYLPGTQFYLTINASFGNTSTINSCGFINTNQLYNSAGDLLKAVSVFPRGQLTELEIKVYKLN